jgi:4-amino-4-deoxy-L-arabinose transferase-like glycosyltransferase
VLSGILKQLKHWQILTLIGLLGVVLDRVWFACDRSVPAWDQAEYLTASLTYWRALQHPQWFSGEWWNHFWQLSSKFPPLTFILTVPFLSLFGRGEEQATLLNLLLSGVLLGAVYALGKRLFQPQVGLWAASLCLLMPGLYRIRLDYLLDYPLVTAVTVCFCCLTHWHYAQHRNQQWFWGLGFGITLGFALLVKQPALLFLFTPLVWVSIQNWRIGAWERIAQIVLSVGVATILCGPWYRANWFLMVTAGKRATIDSAIAEGDPALTTLDAWTYYWTQFPKLVSWPLLLVPLAGVIVYGLRSSRSNGLGWLRDSAIATVHTRRSLIWLAVFWVGAYGLSSLNLNKDNRYVTPYLPVVALVLAYGLTLWPDRWKVSWGTVGISLLLLILNVFGPGELAMRVNQTLTPEGQHLVYWHQGWPHRQVVAAMIQTQPYLNTTLGVLPSTPEINQHNLNFYGAVENFQVFGRQVGTRLQTVEQDVRSLNWFLTKSGTQGSIGPKISQAQNQIVKTVESSPAFQSRTWPLPTGETLTLYQRRELSIQVQPSAAQTRSPKQVQLNRVVVPATARLGQPVPVTYEWSGPWDQLQQGLVLLTWRWIAPSPVVPSLNPNSQLARPSLGIAPLRQWFHDHGVAMGQLNNPESSSGQAFQVTESLAMLPPVDLLPGIYNLDAIYLNRQTSETYALNVPTVRIEISANAPSQSAPELDWVTQLQQLAMTLPQGVKVFDALFADVARLGQYDPGQDAVTQAHQAATYRLQQSPDNLALIYTVALTSILERQVNPAIAALTRAAQLEVQNPWPSAYLAFVHLYNLSPGAAQTALQRAMALNSQQPEFWLLRGVADLMQGKLFKAWQAIQVYQKRS